MSSSGNFADEFWNVEAGDFSGWEKVNQRVKEATKVTTNCVDFLKQLGVALDGFGRNLLKVAKNTTLPDSEYGEMGSSVGCVRVGVECWGEDCVNAGSAIIQQATTLSHHLVQARLARRRCTQLLKPRQQQVKESVKKVHQSQRQAQSRVRELVEAQAIKLSLEGKLDTSQRERDKAIQADNRAEESVKEAESLHRESVTTHNLALDAWCTSATSAFNTMQEAEEARLTVTREVMWGLANICSLLAVNIDQYQNTLRTSLLRVDVGEELRAWVGEHRTQQTPPVPLMYTPTTPMYTNSTGTSTMSSVRSSCATEVSDSDDNDDGSSEGSSPVPLRKARALYQFSPRSGSEVSLAGGEVVTVMEGSSAEWSLIRTSKGQLGFVPANFISPSATGTTTTTTNTNPGTMTTTPNTNTTTNNNSKTTVPTSKKWFK
ncbi:hypothetical protein Pmani_028039 [Petrolisthes manimaculis]|uniref:SH3 domain-containing protein n=1 Tax=Petrolisthes manimaculis TaxID=1843537 RepID=A0AAE1TYG0_9EUCA|nr:hypothetical protein Pmani_028039 [Petrolisthes manimaculis]